MGFVAFRASLGKLEASGRFVTAKYTLPRATSNNNFHAYLAVKHWDSLLRFVSRAVGHSKSPCTKDRFLWLSRFPKCAR